MAEVPGQPWRAAGTRRRTALTRTRTGKFNDIMFILNEYNDKFNRNRTLPEPPPPPTPTARPADKGQGKDKSGS
eukprot:6933635-Pyramimonas_sp.AAC.1